MFFATHCCVVFVVMFDFTSEDFERSCASGTKLPNNETRWGIRVFRSSPQTLFHTIYFLYFFFVRTGILDIRLLDKSIATVRLFPFFHIPMEDENVSLNGF